MKIAFLFLVLAVAVSLGHPTRKKKLNLKTGQGRIDPNVASNKEGKKLAKQKPKTDAKISDFDKDEAEKIPEQETSKDKDKYETAPAPRFPDAPSTSDAVAHESEINGCRDHPLANCGKCSRACYGPEHETYLYAYCRKSCGFCNEKTSSFHNYWRLRANSSFTPTWMLQELELYHEVDNTRNLAVNKSQAYASSNYPGYVASYAFDNDNKTFWYPSSYGEVHNNNDDWIAYEFPIAVRIHSVNIHNDEKFKTAAPQNILVEASDEKLTGFDTKWSIHNTDRNPDRRFRVNECPVLWKKYYDSDFTAWCFRLFSQAKSFEDANTVCEEEGGQLASVLSNEQKNFILKEVKVCVKAWIGLSKEDKAYYWLDGSDSTYHNWKEEHYTDNQLEKDNCVLIDEEGKWELERCEDKNYFICKQKLAKRPAAKPEEIPTPLPYEPEIPPLIFYAPHVTEPVANTKHLPQGVFPDENGNFPDGSSSKDSAAAISAILYKQALKHLDEAKGQKAQVGTKPASWEDPTAFTMKIDALTKDLSTETNTNNSVLKPSINPNIGRLPTLSILEKPQVDLSKYPGVPRYNKTDDSDDDSKQGIGAPTLGGKPAASSSPSSGKAPSNGSQPSNAPANPANNNQENNNVDPNNRPPTPVQPSKEEANKQQEKNPPSGPQKSAQGNIKPPKAQEGPSKTNAGSVGEAGEETNEKDDDDNEDDDDDDDDEEEQQNIPKNPSENKDPEDKDAAALAGQNEKTDKKKKEKKPSNRRSSMHGRSKVSQEESQSGSGSGSSNTDNKELDDILNSMNRD